MYKFWPYKKCVYKKCDWSLHQPPFLLTIFSTTSFGHLHSIPTCSLSPLIQPILINLSPTSLNACGLPCGDSLLHIYIHDLLYPFLIEHKLYCIQEVPFHVGYKPFHSRQLHSMHISHFPKDCRIIFWDFFMWFSLEMFVIYYYLQWLITINLFTKLLHYIDRNVCDNLHHLFLLKFFQYLSFKHLTLIIMAKGQKCLLLFLEHNALLI